jgi:hypothetical protein
MEADICFTGKHDNALRENGPNRSRQEFIPRSGSYLQTMDSIGDAERKVKAR